MFQIITMALFAVCCAFPVWGEGTETLRVPLRFETLDNAVADGNLVRLRREYAQDGVKPIVFEAEEATIIELQSSDKRIMPDTQASGGYYLHYVKKMEYAFTVETPGAYQVRFRGWFPRKAFYCHQEHMDDGGTSQVPDSQSNDPEVWFWTQGAVYELAKGRHDYVFPSPSAFCAGARLDKVALFPVGKDEVTEFGPAGSPISTAATGTAVTKRINLRRITSWRLSYEVTDNGGTAMAEYSFDKVKWVPAPSGATITAPAPKPRFLYFRFTLTGQPGKLSPWIQITELSAAVEAAKNKE